ncbi:MAG: hypothetical protein COX07_01500 [Bacteroidetes bacterium CG23_combo_of_CG06-09_8_20_14_all_32_9]|nr:MAG: hypothetical protein COX07_01500 [Bacteroidetes bacterium CG23_combo_of_CG06-09_8_20_14_all_32_9]
MKIPSLRYLIRKTKNTIVRFPFTILIAIVGTIAAFYVIDFNYSEYTDYTNWYHLIMTCTIGLPMFIAITFFSERLEITSFFKLIIRVLGFIFLLLYFLTLPDLIIEKHFVRIVLYFIGFHLLVSFSPFIGFRQHNAFWQFNKGLFLRFLLTLLYAGVLYTGISLAILAIDQLFNADIRPEWYLRLWIIIIGVFSVCFFLTGIPKYFHKLESYNVYPKGIKIFTQYILIPLVAIYAIILYVYFSKVIITQEWPVGWVVYLVLGYSLLGIFSFLLLYPIYNEAQNKGVKLFTKIFSYSLFPLLVMFFIAIVKRVSEYGFTEKRLFVILLGIWLIFINFYLIYNKFTKIKMVPISLAVIAFLSVSGTWNVFKISKWNQKQRLETLLLKNNLLKDGKVVKTSQQISITDDVEICSIITYLADMHGHTSLQSFFTPNLDTVFKTDSARYYSSYEGIYKLTDYMGIEYNLYTPYRENGEIQYSFSCQYETTNMPLKVSEYDYFVNYRSYFYNYDNKQTDTVINTNYTLADSSKMNIAFLPQKGKLQILLNDTTISFDVFSFMNQLINTQKNAKNGYLQVNKKDMILNYEGRKAFYKVMFIYLSGNKNNNSFSIINEIQADILIAVEK